MPALDAERQERAEEFNWLVGTNIRVVREQREVSGAELARRADISRSHLSRIEAGERGLTFQQALAIAETLSVGLRRLTKSVE